MTRIARAAAWTVAGIVLATVLPAVIALIAALVAVCVLLYRDDPTPEETP